MKECDMTKTYNRIAVYNKDKPGDMIILPQHELHVEIVGNNVHVYSNKLYQAVRCGSHNQGPKIDLQPDYISDDIGMQRIDLTELAGDVDFID